MKDNHLDKFLDKMRAASLSESAIRQFSTLYTQFASARASTLDWAEVQPPHMAALRPLETTPSPSPEHLDKLVVLKLNGGLGTSMGCKGAKSCLPVTDTLTFLDLICQQIIAINQTHSVDLPLVFMNSFATDSESRSVLEVYQKDLTIGSFLQNKFPKISLETMAPFVHENKDLEWNPPGHGDLFATLKDTGLVDHWISEGKETLFVSNADNLGATVSLDILNSVSEENAFVMEVTQKLASDIKGGILARYKDKGLFLIEIAQVPEEGQSDFFDLEKYPVFNTNSLWIHLPTLKTHLDANTLTLTPIQNKKYVETHPVMQLETAMGSAIQNFETASGVIVPRSRFFPIKTTSDFLLLRSDCTQFEDGHLQTHFAKDSPPRITLSSHYRHLDDLSRLIPSPLGLKECHSLSLQGPISVGKAVTIAGDVAIQVSTPYSIKDNTFLKDTRIQDDLES